MGQNWESLVNTILCLSQQLKRKLKQIARPETTDGTSTKRLPETHKPIMQPFTYIILTESDTGYNIHIYITQHTNYNYS